MAIESGICGTDLRWTLDTNTKILQIFGTGAMQNYNLVNLIPNTPWYQYKEYIESIKIEGATSIGQFAFYGCSNVIEVQISETVQSISYQAFRNCSSLTNIEIPNGVKTIRQSTFYDCTSLTSVTLPNSVTKIEGFAFCNCKELKNIIISNPNSVTELGGGAFYNCKKLEKITLSNSLKKIHNATFYRCSNLNNIIIPNSVTEIEEVKGSGGTFQDCTNLTKIVIPKSLMIIGKQAFSGCTNLKNGDVIYLGTQEEWNSINIDKTNNGPLISATKYYWPWWNGKYKYRCKLGNKNNFKYTNELIDDTSLEIVFGNEANSNQIAWYTDDEGWQGLNVNTN